MQPSEHERSAVTLFRRRLPLLGFLDLLLVVDAFRRRPMRALTDHWWYSFQAAEYQPGQSPWHVPEPDHEEKAALVSAWRRVFAALGLDSLVASMDLADDVSMDSLVGSAPLDQRLTRWQDRVGFHGAAEGFVHNLVLHAESEDIAVTWESHPTFLGGFVYRMRDGPRSVRRDPTSAPSLIDADDLPRVSRADVILVLNHRQDWVSTFDVVIHELAHVLLGHLGPMRGAREGRLAITPRRTLSRDAMEVEAWTVGNVVRAAFGRRSPVIREGLMANVSEAVRAGSLESVDVLEVFIAAEILCAWCMSPPQRLGVASGPRKRPPTRPIGWKTRVQNDEGGNR